jgi:hypothetical protein
LGKKRYTSYSFSSSALHGGEWSASRPSRALASGKGPPVPIVQEAGWAIQLEEKSFRLCQGSNLDRPVVQPVARHYTDWGTRLTIHDQKNCSNVQFKILSSFSKLFYFAPYFKNFFPLYAFSFIYLFAIDCYGGATYDQPCLDRGWGRIHPTCAFLIRALIARFRTPRNKSLMPQEPRKVISRTETRKKNGKSLWRS